MESLPAHPRIVVIGTSAAGKTTMARALSHRLGIPGIELDELFWSGGWQPKPAEAFLSLVREASAAGSWVADGNYRVARPVLWPRANLVIWLNYPLPLVFWRGLRRTLARCFSGEALWHGNRESFRRSFLSRESLLWWILTSHARKAREFRRLRDDASRAGVQWLEFRRPAQAAAWLCQIGAPRD